MPIYEYRCSSCGHELETLQKLSDAPLVRCPACEAAALVKLVSAAAFQLKGSGWYATDFKGGAKPAGKPADEAKPAAGATSETKGEATPSAKPETTAKPETKAESKAESKTESATPSSSGTGGTSRSPS